MSCIVCHLAFHSVAMGLLWWLNLMWNWSKTLTEFAQPTGLGLLNQSRLELHNIHTIITVILLAVSPRSIYNLDCLRFEGLWLFVCGTTSSQRHRTISKKLVTTVCRTAVNTTSSNDYVLPYYVYDMSTSLRICQRQTFCLSLSAVCGDERDGGCVVNVPSQLDNRPNYSLDWSQLEC